MENFTRLLMKEAHADVRREFPCIKVSLASVTGPSGGKRKQYFVQFAQDGFPSLSEWVTADDAYHARARAWHVYMSKHFERSESGRLSRLASRS